MWKLQRFFMLTPVALLSAFGVMLIGTWALNGGKAMLFAGAALACAGLVVLIVLAAKTRKSEARTHGLLCALLTAAAIVLVVTMLAVPALRIFENGFTKR